MAAFDIAELTSPISETDPCGPDFDLAGDPDFMNFMARAEGLLPTSFFSGPEGAPVSRTSIDVQSELESARPFLAKTRDIRLLVLLAKFCLFDRDLEGFLRFVTAIGVLLDSQWENVHPRGEDGDFGARLAVLDTLDDMAPVIFPLQYLPLFEDRRLGAVCYRHFMFATGRAEPRESEEKHDLAALEKAATESDLASLIGTRQRFEDLRTALAAIKKACDARQPGAGGDFKKVSDLAAAIFALLNETVVKLDPTAGKTIADAPAAEPAATTTTGRVKTSQDAGTALGAVAGYFARHEPSNPALLLVCQAEQLVGKSLAEIMQILLPAKYQEAKIRIDKEQSLELPIERLAQLDTSHHSAAMPEGSSGADTPPAEGEQPGGEAVAAPPVEAEQQTAQINGAIRTRQDALAMLDEIAAFYRFAEPSSPIALIAERARNLASANFSALIKELIS